MGLNILITGGAGFIGSNLSKNLLLKGHNITVLDNLSPQIHGLNPEIESVSFGNINNDVKFLFGSVTKRDMLENAIKGQDIIVHLAAETGTGQSMYDIDHYCNINVSGTALLLDLLVNKKHSVKKVVVASSRALYGEGKYLCKKHGIVYPLHRNEVDLINGFFDVKCPICHENLKLLATDEDSKLHPTSVYGITKLTQEQLILTVTKSVGISAVALRYQNVYGPGQSLSNPYTGILSIFSTRIRNGQSINIFEDGEESRDFVFIDDVVEATAMSIEKDEANNHIFNVGTGISVSVSKVIQELMLNFNKQVEVNISGNYRLGDIRHNFADITKIQNQIGFTPKVHFGDGIKLFVDWVNKQKNQNDFYEESLSEMKKKGLMK